MLTVRSCYTFMLQYTTVYIDTSTGKAVQHAKSIAAWRFGIDNMDLHGSLSVAKTDCP